ncbi:MAG: GatB/YqeY domain-containing protein [Rhodothermales bacterium]
MSESIKEKLTQDLKQAMRMKDAVRLRTIRSLRAAIQEKEIAERKGGEATLSEEQHLAVLQKQAKQRRDAIAQFEEAGREDLVAKEREELEIIETYLPQQLGDEEIRKVVQDIIQATGAATIRDMGKVMGGAMKQLKGRADGRRINEIARALLADS